MTHQGHSVPAGSQRGCFGIDQSLEMFLVVLIGEILLASLWIETFIQAEFPSDTVPKAMLRNFAHDRATTFPFKPLALLLPW